MYWIANELMHLLLPPTPAQKKKKKKKLTCCSGYFINVIILNCFLISQVKRCVFTMPKYLFCQWVHHLVWLKVLTKLTIFYWHKGMVHVSFVDFLFLFLFFQIWLPSQMRIYILNVFWTIPFQINQLTSSWLL